MTKRQKNTILQEEPVPTGGIHGEAYPESHWQPTAAEQAEIPRPTDAELVQLIESRGWIRKSTDRKAFHLQLSILNREAAGAAAWRFGRKLHGPYKNLLYPEIYSLTLSESASASLLQELAGLFQCAGHREQARDVVACHAASGAARDELFAAIVERRETVYRDCPLHDYTAYKAARASLPPLSPGEGVQ
jgi:hypothetical protein